MPEIPPTEPAPPRACAECGAPQDEQQQICVECGTPVRSRRGARVRPALRPLALALFAILLVTSAAYGLTADAGRQPDRLRQLAAAPPSTTPAPAPAPPAATPAPAPTGTTPAPAGPAPAAKPAAPAPSTPSPTPSSPSPTPAPTPSATPSPSQHTHKSPTPAGSKPHHSSSAPAWLKQGDQPYSATLHDPYSDGTTDEHASAAGRAVDGKASTAWTTADHPGGLGKPGVGLVIEASGYQSYSALGIQTATPGFSVSIYSTGQSDPPATGPADGGWTLEGSKSSVAKQQRITLKGATAQPQYLLVWITKLPAGKPRAGLSEISLLP